MTPPYEYAPFYCEENIARLCSRPEYGSAAAVVVLISNADRRVEMRQQRPGRGPDGRIWWDYHVIGLRPATSGWEVWDFESQLGMPAPADDYLRASFGGSPEEAPRFRVIDADVFARELRSDRSHMRHPDGTWMADPPPWPAATAAGGVALMSLVDMETPSLGEVLTLEECRRRYAGR